MKRITEEKAERLLTFFSERIDLENLPLDDKETYEIFQRADSDGIFMMESEWDKYDLAQVKPKNFDELAAILAMSHNPIINPYLYTYIKIEKIKLYLVLFKVENMKILESTVVKNLQNFHLMGIQLVDYQLVNQKKLKIEY